MEKEKMLYMYVYRMILNDIYNEKYQFQSKLPTLLELCEKFDVGRNTVRSALTQLMKDGYIVMKKGVQATVCFDIHNFYFQERYRQAVRDSQQMVIDVFETIELIFPSICVECLTIATPKQLDELKQTIKNFSHQDIKSQNSLLQELYKIYLHAFSFLENPLLNDLFITLMYSIYQPLVSNEKTHSSFKKSMKGIQSALNLVFKFLRMNNQFMVKNIIVMMCRENSKLSQKYINELCAGLEIQKNVEFIWAANRETDFLYFNVVYGVLYDISRHEYHKDTVLPSISKLSIQYDVSEKTIRKALEVLRSYKVIETINGIGSSIIIDDNHDWSKVLNQSSLKENIKGYYYSYQLLSLILKPLMGNALKKASPEELNHIYQEMKSQKTLTLDSIYNYTFSQCNQCLQTIYAELKKSMGWTVLVERIVDYSQYDFVGMKEQLMSSLLLGDTSQICSISVQISDITLLSLSKLI